MSIPAFANFDLLIDRGPHGYRAFVIRSLAGEPPAVDFALPFDQAELQTILSHVGRRSRDLFAEGAEATDAAIDFQDFGTRLFDAVFAGGISACLLRSLDEAGRSQRGLRIRLRFGETLSELADLPWEYLFSPQLNRFLALSDLTPVVRYLPVTQGVTPLRVTPPLTVLAVISDPVDVPPLEVAREWDRLQEALSPLVQRRQIRLERLAEATLPALQDWLGDMRQTQVHIFHFIGHGFFDAAEDGGGLVFERAERRSERWCWPRGWARCCTITRACGSPS